MLLLASSVSVGCSSSGLPEFPVGLYNVESAADARIARDAGFDSFYTNQTDPARLAVMARVARREGMRMLATPDALIASSVSSRGWPAAAWYVQDEPEVWRVSPAELAAHDKAVRAWAPGTATAFVVGDGSVAARYAASGDVLMLDWYPVPHLPLESFGQNVRAVVAAAGARPTWAVVQAMDWRDFPQRDPQKPRIGRFPTRAEIRFMSYDAVLAGARGVWYYTFRSLQDHTLAEHPGEWLAVSAVAQEMSAMAPIFARGRPVAVPYREEPDLPIARGWTHHGRDYLVLENPRGDVLMRVPDEALGTGWRPLFEVSRDPRELLEPHNGSFYLMPYQVLVLESRLKLSRLLGR